MMAVRSERRGSIAVVTIDRPDVLNAVDGPTAQALIEFARARVGYKAPEEIEFLAEMPLNPTGKVDRVALKRMAAERHAV